MIVKILDVFSNFAEILKKEHNMAYDILLNLPEPWIVEQDTIQDESGCEISHLEAHLQNRAKKRDDGMIDIYVGDMPEGESAEDQALANYAETVGFSEDDPEDFQPIVKFKFNNKNAFGFDAICEDDSPMRFLAQEVRKGVLAVVAFAAVDDRRLDELQQLLEKNFRVK